jgi:hypothetical protein
MAKPELEFHTPAGPWVPSADLAGVEQQALSIDHETGNHTRLMRFSPGADTSEYGVMVHDFWEEIYIVAGELTDIALGQEFAAGMYACRPPGMQHGPFSSRGGATVIEFRYGLPTGSHGR